MGLNHIRIACIFRHSVHFCLHVQQVLGPIYADGAIRTTGAKVMPFTSQHACELKCWGDVTLGRMHNHPATSVSLCISTCPDAGSGTPLSPSQPSIPECASFTYLGPHTVLHHSSKFLWSPIRPAHLSCVPSFRQSLMSSSLRAGIVASRRHREGHAP